MTASWEDEKLACITAEHGLQIYGFWWRLLEIIAKQMDETDRTSCRYPNTVWAKFCGISPKVFKNFTRILTDQEIIISENGSKDTLINIPNILKYRDEYTSKKRRESGQTPD